MDAKVVGPLDLVEVRAVHTGVGSVEELPGGAYEADADGPVPRLFGPVGIGLVVGILCQPGGQVEEAAVRDGVLVVEAAVELRDLPAEAAATGVAVPLLGLPVEDGLSECKPLRLVRRWIGEPVLGRGHGCHSPESLVVVTLRQRQPASGAWPHEMTETSQQQQQQQQQQQSCTGRPGNGPITRTEVLD